MPDLLRMEKNGLVSTSVLSGFKVYEIYKGYSHLKSKMLRYQCTSSDSKISTRRVISIVRDMESLMR